MRQTLTALLVIATLGANTIARAGAVGGPKQDADLAADGDSTFIVWFYAGQLAEVRVHPYDAATMDVLVYDSEGSLVASGSSGYGADGSATWVPTTTGPYTITVVSPSGSMTDFTIDTN